jgi:hypothetical protein
MQRTGELAAEEVVEGGKSSPQALKRQSRSLDGPTEVGPFPIRAFLQERPLRVFQGELALARPDGDVRAYV